MRRILVIGPHPDDLEFGCGGTLYRFSKKKVKLNLLVMTKGEVGGDAEVREREQIKSARILNANLLWGGFLDTQVEMSRKLIDVIEYHIKSVNPDLIMVNYYNDTHQDHRNIAQATITAARYVNNLVFYEVPTSIDFNPSIFTDIENVMNIKMKLLRLHHSQIDKTKVPNLSIMESAKSTAVFRGYQARIKYAEGFKSQRILFDNLIC